MKPVTIKIWDRPEAMDEDILAFADCPYCREELEIKKSTHQITAAGFILPAVQCRKTKNMDPPMFCPFRDFVRLEDWGLEDRQ